MQDEPHSHSHKEPGAPDSTGAEDTSDVPIVDHPASPRGPSTTTSRDDSELNFAPRDPGDGRAFLDWRTRYPERAARRGIHLEALYLGLMILAAPPLMAACWTGKALEWITTTPDQSQVVATFALAWMAGALGGALFASKWLYHAVAKGTWNRDRRLWRVFTPLISGTLAFAVMAIVTSGLFEVLDTDVLRRGSSVVGISFLLGYFSDNTIAKLVVLADRMLGESNEKQKR